MGYVHDNKQKNYCSRSKEIIVGNDIFLVMVKNTVLLCLLQ